MVARTFSGPDLEEVRANLDAYHESTRFLEVYDDCDIRPGEFLKIKSTGDSRQELDDALRRAAEPEPFEIPPADRSVQKRGPWWRPW